MGQDCDSFRHEHSLHTQNLEVKVDNVNASSDQPASQCTALACKAVLWGHAQLQLWSVHT